MRSAASLPPIMVLALIGCGEDPVRSDPEPSGCAAAQTLPATHPIPPETLSARREAALDSLGDAVAVFAAGQETGNAVGGGFRQDSDFYWLTGLEHVQAGWLVLIPAADGDARVRLYLPPGPVDATAVHARTVTGPADVRCLDDAHDDVVALLRSDTLPADSLLRVSFAGQADPMLIVAFDSAGVYDYRPAAFLMARLRAVKDATEIALLTEGARMSADGILAAMRLAAPGLLEADLAEAFDDVVFGRGATRLAFGDIVASGANALELHYRDNDDPLVAGDLVVMDIGAEYGRYAADVARTFPVSGSFTPRQRELYELVLRALEAGIDAARTGRSMHAIDSTIGAVFEAETALCGEPSCYPYFIHYGGHYVGLDVHDGNFSLNFFRTLTPGVVLNVEPGIYLPGEGIGVRIEETVLVTAGDPLVLSAGAPLTVDAIEAAMAD